MSTQAISSASGWVGKLLAEEVQFLAEVRGELEGLKKELMWMQGFLLDADKQQNKNNNVRQCVSDIRDLALTAEDVIEIYILEVSFGKMEKPPWRSKASLIPWRRTDLRWVVCCWRDATTLHFVGLKIAAINRDINQLTRRLQTYDVKSSANNTKEQNHVTEQRRTYSHVQDVVVGLNKHVKHVADKLLNGKEKVVVIHGMGGIGKTTLAKEVYRDASLKKKFGGFAWAYVSQQLQLESLCKAVLLQLIPSNHQEWKIVNQLQDSNLLVTKLFELLNSSDCLVVLDDIWSLDDWKRLQNALPLNFHSSHTKLLVTTRKRKVFSTLPNHMVYYYEAKLLSSNTSWRLFQERVYFDKANAEPEKVEFGEKMLSHCNGHPLAIIMLGGVLATKETSDEWQEVHKKLIGSNQERDELYGEVYEVLALSYYDLPYHLKACFLILGYFPEDFKIPTQRLYHLWIAEGIVQSSTQDNRPLEEIAKGYLEELAHRGMVQVTSMDYKEEIMRCQVHDLMRDKCLVIAREEQFLQIASYSPKVDDNEIEWQLGPHSGSINDKLRRLAVYVHPKRVEPQSLADTLNLPHLDSLLASDHANEVPRLRTLLFFAFQMPRLTVTIAQDNFPFDKFGLERICNEIHSWVRGVSKQFRLLRTLDFTGLEHLYGKLPSAIGDLIYLRYLGLRGTDINELPSEVGNLRSLLILDLRVKWEENLTIRFDVFAKLQSLRQVYFPLNFTVVLHPDNYMEKKMTLSDSNCVEIIEGIDLDRMILEVLPESKSLPKLAARCYYRKEALCSTVQSSSIKKMCLETSSDFLFDNADLISGCGFLEELRIRQTGRPVEMLPPSLKVVDISDALFFEKWISVLEKLPRLKMLTAVSCGKVSELHFSSDGFPTLTHLTIQEFRNLKKLRVEGGGLRKLKTLNILGCPFMNRPPDGLPPQVSVKLRK